MREEVSLSELKKGVYIDKSNFIRKFIDDPSHIIVFTRPRKFLKTSNLKMLQYFFSGEVDNFITKDLFNDMKIKNLKDKFQSNIVDTYQGKYPVICMTFKEINGTSFEEIYQKFCSEIRKIYTEYKEKLQEQLNDSDLLQFNWILDPNVGQDLMERSLKILTKILSRVSKQDVVVLIDEYDAPIRKLYFSSQVNKFKDELEKTRSIFDTLLDAALKDSLEIFKAALTGVLEIGQAGLLDGMESSLLRPSGYEKYFGFTQEDVEYLYEKTGSSLEMELLERWYRGYSIGGCTIYNPWSVISALNKKKIELYWCDIGDGEMLQRALAFLCDKERDNFLKLLQGKTIVLFLQDCFLFKEYDNEFDWRTAHHMLWFKGYYAARQIKDNYISYQCEVHLANMEIRHLFYQEFQHLIFENENWTKNGWGECLEDLPQAESHMKDF